MNTKAVLTLILVAVASADIPSWPIDFTWAASNPGDYNCLDLRAGKFCWHIDKENPGIRFSTNGRINNMRCIRLYEPHWDDSHNYWLCTPNNSPYHFTWSYDGVIEGQGVSCINLFGYGGYDNYVCAKPTSVELRDPIFPDDFKFSYQQVPTGYDCIRTNEPAADGWDDNYFCWKQGTKAIGFKFSYQNPISGMRCVQIKENGDGWEDNYLCWPMDSTYRFKWFWKGGHEDYACVRWNEPANSKYNDNYLCSEKCLLTKLVVKDADQIRSSYEGSAVIGVVQAGSCSADTSGPDFIELKKLDSVTSGISVAVTNSDEINWSLSMSVAVESTTNIFGNSAKVTTKFETSVGGRHVYSKTEQNDNSETTETSSNTRLHYTRPGAGIIIGTVEKYRIDASEVDAEMHMQCKHGAAFIRHTKVKIQSHWFQSVNFEPMEAIFEKEGCPAKRECVRNLAHSNRYFMGNMEKVRQEFEDCKNL